jgi:hypothetical protein
MPESLDPFDPANLRVPDSLLPQPKKSRQSDDNGERCGIRRHPKAIDFQFYQFPVPVLDEILEATLTNRMTVLAVLATLYELWFTRFNQNPVRLTSYSLRKYGISRHQKIRVLKLLERSGQIAVERSRGENPLVTLKWLPLQKEKT